MLFRWETYIAVRHRLKLNRQKKEMKIKKLLFIYFVIGTFKMDLHYQYHKRNQNFLQARLFQKCQFEERNESEISFFLQTYPYSVTHVVDKIGATPSFVSLWFQRPMGD